MLPRLGKIAFGLSGTGLICLLLVSGSCSEDPGGDPGVLLRGPFLAGKSEAAATITWQTEGSGDAAIEYGPTEEYGTEAWGQVVEVELGDESYYVNSVDIGGLEPSTWTHYRITSLAEPSQDYLFKTAPGALTPFRFIVYGGTRPDTPVAFYESWDGIETVHPLALTSAVAFNPDFIVNTGNLVADGYDPAEWEYLFSILGDIPRQIPYYPVMGNEDRGGERMMAAFFGVPDTLYYSFDYANTHFTFINSYLDVSEGSDQYLWLEEDLAAAAEREHIQFLLAFMHAPAYCSSQVYADQAELLQAREVLAPLFSDYEVLVVFQGHVRLFEVTEQIDDVMYLTTSAAGGTEVHEPGYESWTRWAEDRFNFIEVIVTSNYVALNARSPEGDLFLQTIVD